MTTPLFTTFGILAVATLGLALTRMMMVRLKGDECLHLMDAEVGMIKRQRNAFRRLERVDVWGKTLTFLTALVGIAAYISWWVGQ